MTMRTKGSQITIAIICVMGLLLTFMTGLLIPASASETEGSGSITLTCLLSDNETPLPGQEWKLYKVGERSGGSFKLTDDFASYSVSLEDLSANGVKKIADTLESYTKTDSISALKTGTSDENGKIVFSGLKSGLYLISGTKLEYSGKAYTASPSLIEIDTSDSDLTSVTANPKNTPEDITADTKSYKVVKQWKNDENASDARPTSVTVEIYCDSVLSETVTLNEDNDWTYSWTSEAGKEWEVKETAVPDDYTVVYSQESGTDVISYIITNTYSETTSSSQPDSSIPDDSSEVESSIPDSSSEDVTSSEEWGTGSGTNSFNTPDSQSESSSSESTVTSSTPSTSSSGSSDKIPQTGQLWWPVPILSIAGLALIALGWRVHSKKDE